MGEAQSGSEHLVLYADGDEISGNTGKRGDYPRTEDSAAVGPKIVSLVFVRDVLPENERCASHLGAQCAKCDEIHIFSLEEIKAACDQVPKVAERVFGQPRGVSGDVVLHLLKGVLEGCASLRGERNRQETARCYVFADIADHRDLEIFEGDAGIVPVLGT